MRGCDDRERCRDVDVLEPASGDGVTVSAFARGSTAPYCALVTAQLFPGALEGMVEVLTRNPQTRVVAGSCVPLGGDGRATLADARDATAAHERRRRTFEDALHVAAFSETFGVFVLRTDDLRRAVRWGGEVPARIALAAARDGGLVVVDPVVGVRVGQRGFAALLGRWAERVLGIQILEGSIAEPDSGATIRALVDAAGAPLLRGARRRRRAVADALVWRFGVPLFGALYDVAVRCSARLPLAVARPARRRPGKVAYYLWRYPALSETFIRREINALAGADVEVEVIADEPEPDRPPASFDDLHVPARYLMPFGGRRLRSDLSRQLLRRPLRTLYLLAYVIGKGHSRSKSLAHDGHVFLRALVLAAEVRRCRARHLHAPWGNLTAFIAMVAARLANVSFSVQFRAHDVHRHSAALLLAEKMRHAAFVVTNSEYNRRHLRAAQDFAVPVHRIYNGLPVDTFTPSSRKVAGPIARVVSVGRLIEPKGFVYLLEACDRLRRQGYRFHCAIVGGPALLGGASDLVEIRALHARLRLEDCVSFAGALAFPEVLDHYRASDIFVLPCVEARDGSRDITPNALLEAMAMRLPVVSTTLTAIPELIDDGVSGLLVPPRDVDALLASIARLIDDPDLRERLGRAARTRVEERFDRRRNIHSYVELFSTP